MAHNQTGVLFAEAHANGLLNRSVLVRSLPMTHNAQLRERQGTSTVVPSGEGRLLDPLLLIRCNNNIERPVQPSLRGTQPFYSHVERPPLRLDHVPVPLADRLQVERSAIPEVQARPQLRHVLTIPLSRR